MLASYLWRRLPGDLRWLLVEARPLRGLLAAQLWSMLVSSLLALLDPLLVKWLIDDLLPWRRAEMLPIMVLAFLAVLFGQHATGSLALGLDATARERFALRLRQQLVERLQKQGSTVRDRFGAGDLLHRIEGDVEAICQASGPALVALLRLTVTVSLTLMVMSLLSWRVTLAIAPLLPVMVLLRRFGQPRLRDASERAQQAVARRVATEQAQLDRLSALERLGGEVAERRQLWRVGRGAADAGVRRRAEELALDFLTQGTLAAVGAAVLAFGGSQVLAGTLSIGGLIALVTYSTRLFGPLQIAVQLYANWQRATASIRRVREVLETPLALPVGSASRSFAPGSFAPGSLAPGSGDVARTNQPALLAIGGLSYRYSRAAASGSLSEVHADAAAPALDRVDLQIAAGERVAWIGATGSGKSTLARLVVRADDPASGRIRLAGCDLRDLPRRAVQRSVALVAQDPVVFDATVRDNLLWGLPRHGPSSARIDADLLARALEVACLREVVERLPEGLETRLGADGAGLSGGERQRLALARALLRRPRLLLLDEATSALDAVTERRVLDGLARWIDGRPERPAVVFLAHRPAAIRWADRVVLFSGGRVLADGDHAVLQRTSVDYRRLLPERGSAGRSMAEALL